MTDEVQGSTSIPRRPRVSAVMPCLNEARTLPICIEKAQRCMREFGIDGEVVVADNGSTDGSADLAGPLGARVVHESRRGYGAALQAGIAAARGEIIVMADCDDSYDWGEIGRFVQKIDEGYDLVIGNRFRGGIDKGAMPLLHRYLGNPLLSFISRVVFRAPISDFHCGMRAFSREAYERMNLTTTGMEFATEMVASGAHNGLQIAEIPIRLHPDKRGRPPHLRSFRDGWRHLRFIVTYAPDHLYLWPGSTALMLGLLLEGLLATGPITIAGMYLGIHFLVLGAALVLLGVNVLLMGALAKTAVAARFPGYRSTLLEYLERRFKLEHWLVFGALVSACGLVVDVAILFQWLQRHGGSMEETVHPALVATNAIVVGANIVFGAFLLRLMLPQGESAIAPVASSSMAAMEGRHQGRTAPP